MCCNSLHSCTVPVPTWMQNVAIVSDSYELLLTWATNTYPHWLVAGHLPMPHKLHRVRGHVNGAWHLPIALNVCMCHGTVVTCVNECCPGHHQGRVGITWNTWEAALYRQNRQGCPVLGSGGESSYVNMSYVMPLGLRLRKWILA